MSQSYAKKSLRLGAATPSTNCGRTRSRTSGSDRATGKEEGVGRTLSRPSSRAPRQESRRGLPREPNLSRSRPPRLKLACYGPASVSSDSDEELLYERAYLVRPSEDVEQQTEPMDKDLDQDVDSPFSMTQIKTSVMDEEPARERANWVRLRLGPEM